MRILVTVLLLVWYRKQSKTMILKVTRSGIYGETSRKWSHPLLSHDLIRSLHVRTCGYVLVFSLWLYRLASRRVRPRGCRPQTSTATEYEPGPNFVPTMSPPPYDSDKPPDYATVTNNDPGKTSAVGSAAADDSLPAYDNDVSLADEVKECWAMQLFQHIMNVRKRPTVWLCEQRKHTFASVALFQISGRHPVSL